MVYLWFFIVNAVYYFIWFVLVYFPQFEHKYIHTYIPVYPANVVIENMFENKLWNVIIWEKKGCNHHFAQKKCFISQNKSMKTLDPVTLHTYTHTCTAEVYGTCRICPRLPFPWLARQDHRLLLAQQQNKNNVVLLFYHLLSVLLVLWFLPPLVSQPLLTEWHVIRLSSNQAACHGLDLWCSCSQM